MGASGEGSSKMVHNARCAASTLYTLTIDLRHDYATVVGPERIKVLEWLRLVG